MANIIDLPHYATIPIPVRGFKEYSSNGGWPVPNEPSTFEFLSGGLKTFYEWLFNVKKISIESEYYTGGELFELEKRFLEAYVVSKDTATKENIVYTKAEIPAPVLHHSENIGDFPFFKPRSKLDTGIPERPAVLHGKGTKLVAASYSGIYAQPSQTFNPFCRFSAPLLKGPSLPGSKPRPREPEIEFPFGRLIYAMSEVDLNETGLFPPLLIDAVTGLADVTAYRILGSIGVVAHNGGVRMYVGDYSVVDYTENQNCELEVTGDEINYFISGSNNSEAGYSRVIIKVEQRFY
jgi:hypothetical protein